MERYIFWHNTNTEAALNLAIEQSLLDSEFTKENSVFMLWQNAPAVIIGRHQNAFEEVDMAFLKEDNIQLVRRHSGGGAVYHDLGNINFTFIMPSELPKIEFSIVLNPMIKALEKFGIKAELSGRNDILVDNKKISGAAQSKGRHAILVHGTLLVDVDMEMLERVLSGNPDKYESKGIASVRSRVANIKELLGLCAAKEEVNNMLKLALIAYFIEDIEKDIMPKEVISKILENAEKLAKERYRNEAWTLQKSPAFTFTNRKKFPFGSMRVSYNVKEGSIKECKIEGDFFAIGDIARIEEFFIDIPYNQDEIKKALQKIDFSKNILNAPTSQCPEYTEVKSLFLAV